MRIVLDTNILARAARGGTGLGAEIFRVASQPPHVLVLSPFLIVELDAVLHYPRVRAMHKLDDAGIDAYVQTVRSAGLTVNPAAASPAAVVRNDPKDDPIVATAVDGAAEVICTLDRHLRDPAVRAYAAQHGIRVLSDMELVAELRATKTP